MIALYYFKAPEYMFILSRLELCVLDRLSDIYLCGDVECSYASWCSLTVLFGDTHGILYIYFILLIHVVNINYVDLSSLTGPSLSENGL